MAVSHSETYPQGVRNSRPPPLGFRAVGQELELRDTPMYGQTAVLTNSEHEIQVALSEGGRIVSWRVGGREIGFVGRIWGGDMYDDMRLDDESVGLRFHPVADAELLRTGAGVAIRMTLDVAFAARRVRYVRTIGLDEAGAFVETTFPDDLAQRKLWYSFACQFVRKSGAGEAIRLWWGKDGQAEELVLEPKAAKGFQFPPASAVSPAVVRRSIVLAGLGSGGGMRMRTFGASEVSLKVWSSSCRLGVSQTFGQGRKHSPVRFRLDKIGEQAPSIALQADQQDWKRLSGEWKPVRLALETPTARPASPAMVSDFGHYGACNSAPEYMAPLAAAGIGWVRIGGFSWAACEAQPGKADWTACDSQLAGAEQEGLAVIGVMSGNPGWATTTGSRLAPPKDWQAWENHVEQTVRRYGNRIHIWEIWNEPDISSFWQGTAEEYVALLRHAYGAAKRADPDCLVMTAGLDGSGEAYLVKLLELGAGKYCDLVGAHPYAGSAKIAALRMKIMRRILDFYQLQKPLWITEVGWQSGGWKSGPGVVKDEQMKAQRLRDSYPALMEYADVVCWYKGVEKGNMYGLMQPVGQAGFLLMPAWYTTRELACSAAPDISIKAPGSVVLPAGVKTRMSGRVRNDGRAMVSARWIGQETAWGETEPVTIAPGADVEVAADLMPQAYAREQKRDLILVVQRGRRHIAGHVIRADITNEGGKVCELVLNGGWIRKLDATGNAVGKWIPNHAVITAPGEGFTQPLRPATKGNFKEIATLEVSGSAAAWLGDVPTRVTLHVGKTEWVGLHVRVPPGTAPGTYTLNAVLRSTTFPEVSASFKSSYSIGISPAAARK